MISAVDDASVQSAVAMGSGKKKAGGTIINIQAMRGVASIVVFLGHALLLMPGIGLDQFFSFFGVIASSGVDIFFVISGFIITTVALRGGDQEQSRGQAAWNFAVRRGVRVYPVYWVVFACAFALSPWVNFAPPVTDIKPVAQQFFLLTHVNSFVMAAWSLAFEIYFYAIVTLAIFIAPRRVGRILTIWVALTIAIITYDFFIGRNGWIGLLPFSPLILEFIMGMLVAYVIRRGTTEFAMTTAFVGVVSFLAGLEIMRGLGWSSLNPWYRTFYSGLPSAFIIYAVVALELRGTWVFSRAWTRLGDASYSLYIWHQFIFYSLFTLLISVGAQHKLPWFFLVPLWVVPAFLFGFFSYRRIELPIQDGLNRILVRGKRPVTAEQKLKRVYCLIGVVVITLIVCGYTLNSARRLAADSKNAALVGSKIQSHSSGKGEAFDLAGAAVAAGFKTDSHLRGHFDGAYRQPGQIRVHGWAADTSAQGRTVRMLVFYCGRFIGEAPRDRRRPDVARSLGISEVTTGFTVNIPADFDCSRNVVDGLILDETGNFATASADLTGP